MASMGVESKTDIEQPGIWQIVLGPSGELLLLRCAKADPHRVSGSAMDFSGYCRPVLLRKLSMMGAADAQVGVVLLGRRDKVPQATPPRCPRNSGGHLTQKAAGSDSLIPALKRGPA